MRCAVLALLVGFPTYRSYVTDRGWSAADRAAWAAALAAARAADQPSAEAAAQLVEILQAGLPGAGAFLARFQQLSGPAMAKGLEDTELYRSVALAAVNEVGCEPDVPAATPDALHAAIATRGGDRTLVPLSTHDTKRGADTRARLNLVSHDPEGWIDAVARVLAAAAPLRDTPRAPDPLDGWLILQTLLGAWPISADRLVGYVEKALREARRHSSWDDPDYRYEAAACAFARRIVDDPAGPEAHAAVLAEDDVGGAKLAVMRALLGLRRSDLGLFLQGDCVAVPAGPDGFALLRRRGAQASLAAVRLRGRAVAFPLSPEVTGPWHDLLSGAEVTVVPGFFPALDWPFLLLTRSN